MDTGASSRPLARSRFTWTRQGVLYCTALHCIVLYCTVLHCTTHLEVDVVAGVLLVEPAGVRHVELDAEVESDGGDALHITTLLLHYSNFPAPCLTLTRICLRTDLAGSSHRVTSGAWPPGSGTQLSVNTRPK